MGAKQYRLLAHVQERSCQACSSGLQSHIAQERHVHDEAQHQALLQTVGSMNQHHNMTLSNVGRCLYHACQHIYHLSQLA